MEQKEEFKKIIDEYVKKYSPFKLKDSVIVLSHKTPTQQPRPYEITKIFVSEDGDILFELTSPRSLSTIPIKFKINQLDFYNI